MFAREVHLVDYPSGIPTEQHFAILDNRLDDPSEGQVLVKNDFMSVDPAMRPRLSNGQQKINTPMTGGAIGTVVASRNAKFKEGDLVQHGSGWRDFYLSDGGDLSHLDARGFSPTLYMHVLGTTGFTAWGGMLITGALKDNENVFVSAAAGAVGSVAAQIAKIKNCYTIGSAGTDEKCKWLKETLGLDVAINYRHGVLRKSLKAAAVNGIDVYFDNVGGAHLDAAVPRMNVFGRIPVCGMISSYNNYGALSSGITTLSNMVYQRIRMEGFVVYDFEDRRDEFLDDMRGWVKSGQMQYQETIYNGLAEAPRALIGLFTGENTGKALVKLG
ncbi:MAG: NADP-dependent oxidoreductase [Gammaproteobacteria bacterium]|nr:NADP-dependent oxidoreductase [Gammaproteobacteria bacterium]